MALRTSSSRLRTLLSRHPRPSISITPVHRQQQQQPPYLRAPSSSFSRPSPPKLPAEQQAEFERLQREASVSSAFQPQTPSQDTSATSSPSTTTAPSSSNAAADQNPEEEDEEYRGGLYRGAPPEFRGDTNPKTGEVGGPKREPLRWGAGGDWSYNGKVTDF